MKFKYDIKTDRNGYAPSIVQDGHCCHFCGRNGTADKLDRHEVYGGANRQKSKAFGLWVLLCHDRCHITGKNAVHNNGGVRYALQRESQLRAMEEYGWSTEDFIREFGRSYL